MLETTSSAAKQEQGGCSHGSVLQQTSMPVHQVDHIGCSATADVLLAAQRVACCILVTTVAQLSPGTRIYNVLSQIRHQLKTKQVSKSIRVSIRLQRVAFQG
jgi:hypothetical protein